MRSPLGGFIVVAVMLLLNTYVFQAIKTVTQSASPRTRTIIYIAYWAISALAIIGFLVFVSTGPNLLPKRVRTYLFATVIGLFLAQFTAAIFFLIDDVRRAIQWAAGKLLYKDTEGEHLSGDGISRSVFLSWVGLGFGGTVFGSLVYGFNNIYKYQVKRVQVASDNLPAGFKGLRIVHISDIHSGSFTDKKAVQHGIDMILAEKADIILFTGDLVNDKASEMADYMDVFSQQKAPMGVYSTLGNHDYGDYVSWPDSDGLTRAQNLENLKQVHARLGWRRLMNAHVALQRKGAEIALRGIEH